ncbi:MAG: glycerophosphodiester phosphodiesterase [Deltaproteobacteria bacterium]|nr:glycerophosphodiester phosphodiesterase [Deltaproteobacteria bacterium]
MTALTALPPIEVQGHRGARAILPENTLPAFEYALKVGVDVLELDLAVTKDDRLVVSHDPILNPVLCLGPDGKAPAEEVVIRAITLAELKRYDCGTLRNPRFPGQTPQPGARVPTLEEVFDLLLRSKHEAAKRARLNLETKLLPARPAWAPAPAEFARLLVAEIKKHHLEDRVIVQSFDHRSLREVKRLLPSIPVATLSGEVYPDFVAMAKSVGAEIVSPNLEFVDRAAVDALHAAGVRVIPWTANTEEQWRQLVALGVDGIITDDPAALIAFLKRQGRR